jgi:hypothetical protein
VRYKSGLPHSIRRPGIIGIILLAGGLAAWPQTATPSATSSAESVAASVRDLQEQVRDLRAIVQEMHAEAAQSRAESADLRRELEAMRTQLAAVPAQGPETAATSASSRSLEDRVGALEDSSQLLGGKIDEQYQSKVESASKYRVRLSGIALLNLFSNRGSSDNQDVPSYAFAPNPYSSNANVGATLRQSEIGLEVFGPRLAGARTSGTVQADFSGGFPNAPNGVSNGIFRLRTANMRLDWKDASIVVGQDNLFFSPSSPSSFASLSVPAFAYAGNLWGWIPQVRAERRFDLANGKLMLQGAFLDNLTGEPPYTQYGRIPQAGEQSGQPGYAGRLSWKGKIFGEDLTLGTAGYYSPQNWGFGRNVDGWATLTDWDISLTHWVALSGEFFRGRALGGLGGGVGRSVLFAGDPLDPATLVRGLNSIGGWSQLKIKATPKLEFNGGFGLDNPFAGDVRMFAAAQSYLDPSISRNFASLVNFVYRPRSNLLFSSEYRRLVTSRINNDAYAAGQVNLVMGVLF